jgi:hypothetical protein
VPKHVEERLRESGRNGYRLGRHVNHDPRSLAFAATALPFSALVSKRWERRAPVFDQGALGSCTANAAMGWYVTDNAIRKGAEEIDGRLIDENYVIGFYHDETKLDSYPGVYPPDDTGSNGLTAAKVLKKRGFAKAYQHAFGLRATLSALQSSPVLLGVSWLQGMFNPVAGARLVVSGQVAGGHEILLDEIDVKSKRVWIQNSWGNSWGPNGRAWMSWENLETLLGMQGDCVLPIPA